LFVLGAFLCLLGGVYIKGHSDGVDGERKEWQAAQTQVLETQLKEVERVNKINADISAKLAQETARADANYRSYKDAIAKVTDGRICFTPDAWRVWITALGGKDNLPPTTGATPSKAAGASDAEVLGNAVENFRQYKACREQLNSLIEWHKKVRGE
jgi:hypothetical protein